jgi:hypothetical protein
MEECDTEGKEKVNKGKNKTRETERTHKRWRGVTRKQEQNEIREKLITNKTKN